jgi:seryl-tRNA synthetase
VDLETGERVSLLSNQVKSYYVEQIAKYKQQLRLKCLQFKIDYVEADINQGFDQILAPYLIKRSKMM